MNKAVGLLDQLLHKLNNYDFGKAPVNLSEEPDKSAAVLSTLKIELTLSVNQQVQEKPPGWMVRKKAFSNVLKMIKTIEGEV